MNKIEFFNIIQWHEAVSNVYTFIKDIIDK